MGGYNYMNGGYYTNDPNKGSYGGIECSDHVCRPVIVDAEGRKRPIIAYTPSSIPESYIATSAERVVEHVHAPVVITEYQYVSQAKVNPMRDYDVPADKWRRPSSPVHDRPQVMVTEYGYSSPITEVEPAKYYGVTGDKWHWPSSPVRGAGHDYGYGSPTKVEPMKDSRVMGSNRPHVGVNEYGYGSPIKVEPVKEYRVTGRDRPSEVDEFITKVQTEASRPTRPSVLSGANWRNRPNSTGQGGNPGYGEYANYNNSDNWNKPSGNTIQEPTITNREGWERPSRETPLSGPTNDIGKAMEILNEAVKPSPTLKRDTYTEVIDSREAARRYGNFNPTSRPFQTGETYTGTIDSREAARKYMGSSV